MHIDDWAPAGPTLPPPPPRNGMLHSVIPPTRCGTAWALSLRVESLAGLGSCDHPPSPCGTAGACASEFSHLPPPPSLSLSLSRSLALSLSLSLSRSLWNRGPPHIWGESERTAHNHRYTYIHTYIHTYVHTYIHACMHTYIHTYLLTYLNTYIHTFIRNHTNAEVHK